MRKRTISGPTVTGSNLTPFQKLEEFTRKILAVPKTEADKVQAKLEKKKKG